MVNRLLAILVSALLFFPLASCGIIGKKDDPVDSRHVSGIENAGDDKEEGEKASVEADELEETGDIEEAELPEGFRTDLVPLFKGSVILDAVEDAGMPDFLTYSVTCCSDKPFIAVAAFYKEIMSHHQILEEQEDAGYYYVTGSIGETDMIDIGVQDMSEIDDADLPEYAKTVIQLMYRQPKKGELPEGYRDDLAPVMEGSRLKQDRVFDTKDGKKVYSLTFETDSEFEDVTAFHREIMADAGSVKEDEYPGGCNIEGTKDNVRITISISSLSSGEFKTAYTIEMVM